MGIFSEVGDFLFGEDPSVQHSTKPRLTPEQMELLQQLARDFKVSPDLGDAARGTTAFTGKMAPDLSSLERTSLAALEEMAMQQVGGDRTLNAARGAVEKAASSDVDLEAFNQFFRGAVEEPTIRSFKEEVLPDLTRRFAGSAAFGSDRLAAENLAVGRLGQELGGSRAEMLFKTQESAKDRSLQAAGIAPEVVGGQSNALLQLLSAGGVPRAVEDTRLTRDYAEFVRQQESKRRSMEMALALLGLSPIENISTVNPGKQGFLTAAAPGAGMALTSAFLK